MRFFFSPARAAAVLAASIFLMALLVFGRLLDGYLHAVYPIAWLGATGVPRAAAFNVSGFIVPGLLAALLTWQLRQQLPTHAPLVARVGAWMVLLSALAFALKGVLPLDPQDLESSASRAHSLVWMAWWVAFTPGALLHALGRLTMGRRRADAVHRPWPQALLGAALALLVCGCAAFSRDVLAPALGERIAYAAWFAWLVLMAPGASQSAAASAASMKVPPRSGG